MTAAIKWRGKSGKEPHVNIEMWLDEYPFREVVLSRKDGLYRATVRAGFSGDCGSASDPDQTYAIRKAILDLESKR